MGVGYRDGRGGVVEAFDGRGSRVVVPEVPRRLVSLVPSTTETLFDLGLGPRVVGCTRYCLHPAEGLEGVLRVGGTKDADVEAILELGPELVLANCEENTREIIESLERHVPVWAAFPRTVDAAIADLQQMAGLLGASEAARAWVARIELERRRVHRARHPARVSYLIWRKPWMRISADTFIASLLAEAGWRLALPPTEERFPVVQPSELAAANPDRVLLSSEPFPFARSHLEELVAATGLPAERFCLVDGENLSWHGSRMARGMAYLAGLAAAGSG